MAEHIIKDVKKNSIAKELGIKKGDILISVNGNEITDLIDYKYQISGDFINILIRKDNGEEYLYDIEKNYDEDLGLIFETGIIDKLKRCRNKCVFCFIDQLPDKVRNSLVFKDDDYRLSFLQGNFVTLTNLNDEDFLRIIKYRMSPIYISVHATDDEVRKKIMQNPHASGIFDKLKKLTENGIEVHCQIVLCPGLNDGEILDKTISDLSKLYPGVKSAAAVPVGLTDHREGLYKLKPYDAISADSIVKQVSKWQNKLKKELGSSFIFLADEFYVLANKAIPDYSHYEGFPQIENGVGLMAKFKKQFDDYFKKINNISKNNNNYCVVTGVSAYKFIREFANRLNDIGININVIPIINDFFGHKITVAGLITGRDIINQIKEKINDEILVIPNCMLREGTNVFLDDTTVEDLEDELKTKVIVSPVDGEEFIRKIIGR